MAGERITDLALADTPLDGSEFLELAQMSLAVAITATTISAQASDNSYNDSAAQFIAEGFAVGNRVNVIGFTGNVVNNIVVGTVTALTAGKMTIGGTDGDVIVDDAAGESVTIRKWESRRVAIDDLPSGGGGAALEIEDQGTSLDAAVVKINFVGAGVTATQTAPGEIEVDVPGGGGGGSTPWYFDPPAVADFTTAFGGAHGWASLTDDADVGLCFDAGAPEAGDKTIYAYKAIPSPGSGWTATMHLNASIPAQNFSAVGIICQNSTNSRIMMGGFGNGVTAVALKLLALNPGGFVGEIAVDWNGNPNWLRLVKTATHIQYWASRDGKAWTMVAQDTLAAHIGTPDRIGFGVLHNRATGPQVVGSIDHFEIV